jgi:type II secretory pathway pseudopilin PulG
MSGLSRGRSEAGTTLIELIMAVAIMGVAFVAILGGIGSAIIGADVQRRDATAGLVLSSAAERIVAETAPYEYKTCVGIVPGMPYPNPADATSPESGYTVKVTRVTFWDPSSNRFVAGPASCTPDPLDPADVPEDSGLQLIQLTATSASGTRAPKVEVLEVVKRKVDT